MTVDASAATAAAVGSHLRNFSAGNVQGMLADYAPDAVLITPTGVHRGADGIRPVFEALVAEFSKPGATFAMQQQVVENDVGYIRWTAETADNTYELATDTFVVRDGKIQQQTFACKTTPK